MLNEPAGELSSREKDKSAKKQNIGLIASANACARGSIIIGPASQHYLSILLEGSGERERGFYQRWIASAKFVADQ